MKRFTIGLMAVTCALTLSACSGGTGQGTGEDEKQETASPDQAAVESQEAEERADLSPADFSNRILSLDDLPDGFVLEDEVEFGEKEGEQPVNPLDTDNGSTEAHSSQSECVMGAMAAHSSELDGVSAARSFDQSDDNSGTYIMTSLTRPERESRAILEDLRKTVEECQQTIDAGPTESVDVFDPNGNKGEGFCTAAFNGTFSGQGKIAMSECYIAWAGELLTVHQMAFEAETTRTIDEEAMDGVTDYMTDEILQQALKKADMVADRQ